VGPFTFTVRASNGVNPAAVSPSRVVTISAAASAPVFLTDTPPATGTVGTAYSYTYTASGNPKPTYALASGALPPGLSLNTASGVLSGTPSTVGPFTFTVRASNGVNPAAVSPSTVVTISAAAGPAIDRSAIASGYGTVTAHLTTTVPGDLIVAFVAADGPSYRSQDAKVSGGGLKWTLVRRRNSMSGTAEIWVARATGVISNAAITSSLARRQFGESLSIVAFSGASGVGQTSGASGRHSAPLASLRTTSADSWVFGVGNDPNESILRTLGVGQTLVSQSTDPAGATYWVQSQATLTPAAGTRVVINDLAPSPKLRV
jgi:hypothetical protein